MSDLGIVRVNTKKEVSDEQKRTIKKSQGERRFNG